MPVELDVNRDGKIDETFLPLGSTPINPADTAYYLWQPSALATLSPDLSDVELLHFDIAAGDPVSPAEGDVWWNSTDKTLNVYKGGITLQVGQEFTTRIINKTGVQIDDGTPISIPTTASAINDRPKGEPTNILNASSCRCFIGIASENIAIDKEGEVTKFGLVRNINTNSYNEGDRLWVSGTGSLTATEPTTGNKILVGMVIKKSAGAGVILVNPRIFETTAPHNMVGHEDRTQSRMSYNDGTRQFGIYPVSTHFNLYLGDGAIGKTTTQNLTVPATDSVGFYYAYFDNSTQNLAYINTEWDITGLAAPTAQIYWDGVEGIVFDERHCPRNSSARKLHEMLHETVHARWAYGLQLTATDTTFSFSTGEIYDEDLEHLMTTRTTCRVMYNNASNQARTWGTKATSTRLYPFGGAGVPQYNNAGTITDLGTGNYGVYWIYGNNEYNLTSFASGTICSFVGTSAYSNLTTARAATQILPANFSDAALNEWKLLYRVIYRNNAGSPQYIENVDYRTSSNLPAAGLTSLPASSVTYTATSPDTSTNAQQGLDARQLLIHSHLPNRVFYGGL